MDVYTENLNTEGYCPTCNTFKKMGLVLFCNNDGEFEQSNLYCQECNTLLSNMQRHDTVVTEIKNLIDVIEKYANQDNWESVDEYGKYGGYSITVWHPFGYEDGWDLAQNALDNSVLAQDADLDFWPE